MNRKSTYRNVFLAAWHIPLAMLLSVFAITSYSSQEFHHNKQLGQTEWVSFNRKTSKVGKISFAKALHLKKENATTKPSNWKVRIINYNRLQIALGIAYRAYSLNIGPHDNFILSKVIPNNIKDEPTTLFMG